MLEYKKLPDRILEMYHTEVPTQHRGKGLAETLVKVSNYCTDFDSYLIEINFKDAFRYCLDNNFKVYPTCSFVDRYSREMATKEEKQIVVKDIKQPYINTDVTD